jgi:hypothetical protein
VKISEKVLGVRFQERDSTEFLDALENLRNGTPARDSRHNFPALDSLAACNANDMTAIAVIVLKSRLQPTFSPLPF